MRRVLRALLLVGAALVLLELASLAAGLLTLGAGFVARGREERALARSGAAQATLPAGADIPVPASIDYYALHPYLGFVADPGSTVGPVRDSEGRLATTPLGFFRRVGDARPPGAALRVAVFGGSVAFLFSLTVDEQLEALLGADGPGRERGVVVESFAVPGHKQPQQLFALEYLLLLGERFDLVLNLDGFNEIALPLTENASQGTAGIYPRSWAHLAGSAPAPTVLAAAARVAALREGRRAAADALGGPVLDRMATAALLWHAANAALAGRLADAEARLASSASGAAGYAVTGPAGATAGSGRTLDELVEIWRRSSLLMHQVCAANGIAYVHVLQPNQYLPGAKPMDDAERAAAYRPEHPYRAAVEAGYPRLAAAGEALLRDGVTFVDMSRAFAGVRERLYVDDCCHFNPRGSALLAEHLAPALRSALAAPTAAR